jgi:hypothetical protein
MRKARSTENAPVAGISAMATMVKSKMRHGSRQKPRKSGRQPRADLGHEDGEARPVDEGKQRRPKRSIHQGEVSSPSVDDGRRLTLEAIADKRDDEALETRQCGWVASLSLKRGESRVGKRNAWDVQVLRPAG